MNLSTELTQQANAHLDEVRNYLGTLPADERQEILQSIESHIYDALENRSDGESTPALLNAVIAEMDPPDSYGDLPAPKKRMFNWRNGIAALIGVALIAAGIKWWPTTASQDPTGSWSSVDFVSSTDQFNPEAKSWHGNLYLKELTFLPEGKTDRLFWTWEEGILHHSGDNTDAKFLIKKVSGKEYLFLEWMSGDVIQRGQPPKYYVLKRTDQN